MIVECKYCNKKFNIRPSAYNKSKTKIFYCCREHMNIDKNIGYTKVNCSTCNKEFYKKNSQIYKHNFCSKECQKNFIPKIKLICRHCNKEFELKKSYYDKQTKRGQTPIYCSKECKNSEQRKDMEWIKCIQCGKLFLKNKNKINKDNGNCCSIKCKEKYFKTNHTIETQC